MPKILIVNTGFGLGGVEMFFLQVSQHYAEKGYECHFLSLMDDYPMLTAAAVPQERIHVLFPGRKTKPSYPETLRRTPAVRRILKQGRYEAIFTGLYMPAMPVWLSNFLFRREKVFFFLMQTADYMVRHSWFWKSGLMKRGNTYVIAISNYLRDSHAKLFPSYERQFRTCILPVNTKRFHPRDQRQCREILGLPQDKKIVGICSRLSPEKGFALVVQAIREVKRPDLICVIYGSGPMEEELRGLIAGAGLEEKLIIRAPRQDTEIIYNAFDIYFQAGKGPSLGLSTLEAFASGIPNITITRDAEEVVMAEDTYAGYNAGLITTNDPATMGADIERLLAAPDFDEKKKEARRLAEEVYSWETFMACLMPLHQGK